METILNLMENQKNNYANIEFESESKPLTKEAVEEADYIIGNYINCYEDGKLWANPIFNLEKYKEIEDVNKNKNVELILNERKKRKRRKTSTNKRSIN